MSLEKSFVKRHCVINKLGQAGTQGLIPIDCSSTFVPEPLCTRFSLSAEVSALPGKFMKVLLGGELLSEMVKGTV